MSDLLSLNKDIRIVRLNEFDSKNNSDHLRKFKELVLENEPMYPSIRKWIDNKVLPGLKSNERVAFVGYQDENPVVSAVVKRGKHSKFCHLKIGEHFQNLNLGEVFFAMMALEVRNYAEEIHFTLPESLWESKKDFFRSFGFNEVIESGTQYRLFDPELKCSSSFLDVWKAALDKLPKIINQFSVGGYSMANAILMSIKPEYADQIISGKKSVELRRKFSKKWIGSTVTLYASAPRKALVGEAKIKNVISDNPNRIWEDFGVDIGCTKKEFDEYTLLTNEVYAIVLGDVKPYQTNMPVTQMSHLINTDLVPPQSYCTLENNKSWAEAVSVAALLHGNFRHIPKIIV
ncbi:ASCH domain-containing protein [bacterium]|nr:ASCH domain-containing protein [bacterium]